MKRVYLIGVLVIVVISFSNCKKESNGNTVTNNGARLSRIYNIYKTLIDTMPISYAYDSSYTDFIYDNNDRLISLNFYYSTDPADHVVNYNKTLFFYNGTDTMPYKKIVDGIEGGNFPPYTIYTRDTSYYSYDALNRIILDSNMHFWQSNGSINQSTGIGEYTYSTNLTVRKLRGISSGIVNYIDSIFFTYQNGNITRQETKSYNNTGSLINNFIADNTYDNHPNPLYAIPAMRVMYPYAKFEASMVQKNNELTVAQTYGVSDNNYTNTYTYRAIDGYPTEINISRGSSTISRLASFIYQ